MKGYNGYKIVMDELKWFCADNECREPTDNDGKPCKKCGYKYIDCNDTYKKYNL